MTTGKRKSALWTIAVVAFAAFIAYATFNSTDPQDPGELALREAAEQVCWAAVDGRITVASYPFPARVHPDPTIGYRVEGTVDTGASEAPLARYNYECLVAGDGEATMTVDSLALWQSH